MTFFLYNQKSFFVFISTNIDAEMEDYHSNSGKALNDN